MKEMNCLREMCHTIKHIGIMGESKKDYKEKEAEKNIQRNNGWEIPNFIEKHYLESSINSKKDRINANGSRGTS